MLALRCSALLLPVVFLGGLAAALPQPQTGYGGGPNAPYETGPVLPGNFPDPCIIQYDGWWYTFATKTTTGDKTTNIQIARSADYQKWELVTNPDGTERDALPYTPAWVNMTEPNTWAPDVNLLDDGTFIMYYSAVTLANSSHHCVGAATSKTILGPYMPEPNALYCPLSQGGAIDASGFKDWDGSRYVVYKVDGNSIGHGGVCGNSVAPIVGTPIIVQPVAADGVTADGPAATVLNNEGVSDDGVVEAPSLVRSKDGDYVLFFSSGCFSTADYTVSYAISKSVDGPYTRYPALLKTGDDGLYGPGGADIWQDAEHVVFHADLGTNSTTRQLYVGEIVIQGSKVII